jgi:hypothetical protein
LIHSRRRTSTFFPRVRSRRRRRRRRRCRHHLFFHIAACLLLTFYILRVFFFMSVQTRINTSLSTHCTRYTFPSFSFLTRVFFTLSSVLHSNGHRPVSITLRHDQSLTVTVQRISSLSLSLVDTHLFSLSSCSID